MRKDPTEFRKRFAAYKNGKSPYKAGRPVEDDEFESFRQTLPDNQKPIGGYRTKRYWELNGKPKTFGEAIGLGMYTLGESGKKGQYGMEIPAWHANSVAYDESTGNYEFMKPNTHDTRWMEDVYGYWSPDNKDFRENYKLQKGVVYDKYVPKKNVYEMPKYGSGKTPNKDEDHKRLYELGRKYAEEKAQDYLTTSTDNVSVKNNITKIQNPHLSKRAQRGAEGNAAWEKEHPIMSNAGMILGSAPLAVASAPAVMAGGDALAGSAVGHGITSLLTNPYFDAAMTSMGGAHATQSIANGEADAFTALELLPMTRLAKPVYNAAAKVVKPVIENEGFAVTNPFTGDINWIGKGLGSYINVSPTTDGWLGIDYINSTRRGVGRKMYDAAIKEANKQGLKGVKSGESLHSAPKTYNIWEHYPDKVHLGNYGSHGNSNMVDAAITTKVNSPEELVKATRHGINAAVMRKAPVYGLTTPSNDVPLLSLSRKSSPDAVLDTESKIKPIYNSVKGFMEKIPGLRYSTVDKFPKMYSRREYDINNLPNDIGKKLKLFYSEDVYPRFTQLGKYNKTLTPEQQRLLGKRGDILDDLKFVFYENPKSKMSGFVNNNPNTIYINRSHVDSDKKLFEIIAHETEHYLRRLLKEKSYDLFGTTGHNITNPLNPNYTDSETSTLKRGYLFDMPFIKKNKEFKHTEKRTSEMGAENRRHRANIFYDTGFTGSKLDDYIDNLSNDLLIELMNSGYGKSFQRTFKKDNTLSKNMKNAMKIVPAVSIPIISNNTTSD